MITMKNKKGKIIKIFDTTEEWMKHSMTRTNFQKIRDRIQYGLIRSLTPRTIYWRIKNKIQKLLWGFNDIEIMDLDTEFASWIIPELKKINTSKVNIEKIINAFDISLHMEEKLMKTPFTMEKYRADLTKLTKEMNEGLELFVNNIRFIGIENKIIDWILPRLHQYATKINSHPNGYFDINGEFIKEDDMTIDKWKAIVQDMILSFELLDLYSYDILMKYRIPEYDHPINRNINKGLSMFARHFKNLWI